MNSGDALILNIRANDNKCFLSIYAAEGRYISKVNAGKEEKDVSHAQGSKNIIIYGTNVMF